jgi:Fur family ferric uptake transcriptional regulator
MTVSKELRMTKQRRVILEELKKMESHPTADDIFQVVRRKLPRMSLGTVYRNLETMSQFGIIRKLEISGSAKRFDAKLDNHYHIRCVKCGGIEDLPVKPFHMIEDLSGKLTDYKIFGHSLEIVGLCPHCRNDLSGPKAEEGEGERLSGDKNASAASGNGLEK